MEIKIFAMNITILGWYGTETIGDRGILAGILSFIGRYKTVEEIFIGSLFPFFTERTVFEDNSFWKKAVNYNAKTTVFDSTKSSILEQYIERSDIVLVGGGPLMHIDPMYMLAYAFKYAKRKKKKTAVFGSGIGPIFTKKHKVILTELFKYSDRIILRDTMSLHNARNIYNELDNVLDEDKMNISLDPAVEACLKFKSNADVRTVPVSNDVHTATVSLRSFPEEYLKNKSDRDQINERLTQFYKKLVISYDEIRLIPMHYFFVGGDDREYLNKLYFEQPAANVHIQNVPLSLEETMKGFQTADICYGMRFHSVVFQTILNGKNFVIDYTEPRKGKIRGFIDEVKFPPERYVNIQECDIPDSFFIKDIEPVYFNTDDIIGKLKIYDEVLGELS